jgi:hypothetical protein
LDWKCHQKKKSEKRSFLGQVPGRCKIVVDNKCLQQVQNFKYFGCKISYENVKDIDKN